MQGVERTRPAAEGLGKCSPQFWAARSPGRASEILGAVEGADEVWKLPGKQLEAQVWLLEVEVVVGWVGEIGWAAVRIYLG